MDHDDDAPHDQHLSTPLLEERSRVKCVKYPSVYHVTLPRSALSVSALKEDGQEEECRGLVHIAPSHGYPDVLEVQHVPQQQQQEQQHGVVVHWQDRVTHVDGQPVLSLQHLRRLLAEGGGQDVAVRLMRKQSPHVEYVDLDDPSLSTSASSSAEFCDEDDEASLLMLLMTGGGCISFSPSTTSSSLASSLGSSSSSLGHVRIPSRGMEAPLQPYESWGDEASLDIHGLPLFCFPLFVYEVVVGDILPLLARAFGLKVDDLRRDNRDKFRIGEPGVVVPGQLLRVRNVAYDAKATALLVSRKEGGDWRMPTPSLVPSSEEEGEGGLWRRICPGQRLQHVVVGGETMKGLCGRYGMSELDIRRLNRGHFPTGEPSVLREGMRLVIYPCSSPPRQSPSAVGALLLKNKGYLAPSTGSTSSSSSRSSSSSGEGGGRGGGDGRPLLFPIVDVGGVV